MNEPREPATPDITPKRGLSAWSTWLLVVHGVTLAMFAVLLWNAAGLSFDRVPTEGEKTVRRIARAAKASYERIVVDKDGRHAQAFCKSASGPVPKDIPHRAKTSVSIDDWDGDDWTGWHCLKVAIEARDVRCQANYVATPDTFEATAKCDEALNGIVTTYRIRGRAIDGHVQIDGVETFKER
jgi:hypothetical protein